MYGVHIANSYDRIQSAARDEWGFQGLVMTDWYTSQHEPDLTGSRETPYGISASTGCIFAGNDIQMPSCQKMWMILSRQSKQAERLTGSTSRWQSSILRCKDDKMGVNDERKRVMVLDDEFMAAEAIGRILREHGLDVVCEISTERAIELFSVCDFCLVIMDIHLDASKGILVLQYIKEMKDVPVLVVSSLQEKEILDVFYAGADVCLLKPVNAELCAAQALALIRLYNTAKHPEANGIVLTFGPDILVDPNYHQVLIDGEPLDLTRREFNVLYYLASNSQLAIRYDQIYREYWGAGPSSKAAVRACINHLRKKLLCVKNVSIRNVWGIGYQFVYEDKTERG